MGEIIFITGTDTGVGKTVLTALLLQHLRSKKINALAIKPFCTGDRGDVELIQGLQSGELSDAEVNPYFFPQPVAPFVAAKQAGQTIQLHEVIEKITAVGKKCDLLLVEGAGGIMVPIAENLLMRDLIIQLEAKAIVVCANKLGTLNHTLLTVSTLQVAGCKELKIVLVQQKMEDSSARSNSDTLKSFLATTEIFPVPFLGETIASAEIIAQCAKKIEKTLAALTTCS